MTKKEEFTLFLDTYHNTCNLFKVKRIETKNFIELYFSKSKYVLNDITKSTNKNTLFSDETLERIISITAEINKKKNSVWGYDTHLGTPKEILQQVRNILNE